MDMRKETSAWKKSWIEFFKKSDSDQARKTLAQVPTKNFSEIVGTTGQELRRLLRIDKNASEETVNSKLASMTIEDLQGHVSRDMSSLQEASQSWQDKRRHGVRKVGTGLQEFADFFDMFLAGFSGVVEIVKMADSQYGGIATTVLSVFFSTVKLKAANDRSIHSSMRMLANQLPDLQIYYQIYADSKLAAMLTLAYTHVLSFAKAATTYFQGHGYVRAIKSVSHPQLFKEKEEDIIRSFQDIRIRCDALLAERIYGLSADNAELINQMETLQTRIQELQVQHDHEAFQAAQAALGNQSLETKDVRLKRLNEYRTLLKNVFAEFEDELTTMGLAELQEKQEYHFWRRSGSSLLVVYGYNHEMIANVQQSWLSLAALDMVHEIHASGAVIAYESCSPSMTTEEILKHLILQLLQQQPHVSRMSDWEDIRAGLNSDNTSEARRDSIHSPPAGLVSAMTLLLAKCTMPVYLVIDRPDICEGHTWACVKAVLKLVTDVKGNVKILIVMRIEQWNIEQRMYDIDEESKKKLICLRLDQDEL